MHRDRKHVRYFRSVQCTDTITKWLKTRCFKIVYLVLVLQYLYSYLLCIELGFFVQFVKKRSFSSAIWLLFLDTNTSLEQFFTDINIPFDCQFLVAQPQGDHVVVLTEVYRVSPTLPLQTYRFGNWTAGAGLTWPSQHFYRRRNNLQGIVLRVAVKNVICLYLLHIFI